jgi:hypothetical protein
MVQASLSDSVSDQANGRKVNVSYWSDPFGSLGHVLPLNDHTANSLSWTLNRADFNARVLEMAEDTQPTPHKVSWHFLHSHLYTRLPVVAEEAGVVGGSE